MHCRCNPDADLRRLERAWEATGDAETKRAYWHALRRVYPEFLAEHDYKRIAGKHAFELTTHAKIKWRNQHTTLFVYPDGSWLRTDTTQNIITWGYGKYGWASRIMFPRSMTSFSGLRRNPDADLRRLERIFQQDPTSENRNRLNDARMRVGLSLILDIPKGWEEWARDYPPGIAMGMPEHIYGEADNYIDAERTADEIEVIEGEAGVVTCRVLFFNHVFYVVPKDDPKLLWLCAKCRGKMSYVFDSPCWICKACGWSI